MTHTLIAVPGGWMIDNDENIYPTQAAAIAGAVSGQRAICHTWIPRNDGMLRIIMAPWLLPGIVTFEEWCNAVDEYFTEYPTTQEPGHR